MKVYTSKLGLKFAISSTNRPRSDEVVFFTRDEFQWIKRANLSPEAFKAIWKKKAANYQYTPIPEKTPEELENLALLAKQVFETLFKNKQS